VERRHAVAIGARRAGDAACAIVKGPYPVSVGAGASGDAAVGVVENARVLSLGGRERRKRGQECDGDDSHDRSLQRHRSLPQSSSASRFTAGAAGFLNLSQCRERPLTYGEPRRA